MAIIKVEQLSKQYGMVKAVNAISFEVKQGTLFGFLGVNGAGKSTTIHMLSTLLSPTSGSAQICGYSLEDKYNIRKKIGIVYQQNCLDNLLTVEENLMCRAVLYEKSETKNRLKLKEVCRQLELEDLQTVRYRTLSGGQKRRCEIAAALMHTPEILFLDEPTTGLDPATRKSVWETIGSLQKTLGMTVFLTTHYMEEAAESDKIVILDHGTVIAEGTPFELKEQYAADKLRLYSNDIDHLIKRLNPALSIQRTKDTLTISLRHTLDSFPILSDIHELLSGFEVIQGTMDDVFLNACGKTLTEEETR